MTEDTYGLALRLLDATRRQKLVGMLQSMSQRFPNSHVESNTQGDFGVLLGDGRYLGIRSSGHWTDVELRDFFALFALWCVVDREGLTKAGRLGGVSRTARLESARCSGRQG